MSDDLRNDATEATRRAHADTAGRLPPDDGADFALARRGFLGSIPDAEVPGAWSQAPFAFLDGERPDTVNPSLWRQARLNALHGLFEVTPGVYQVRGFDISNVTFIEGREGWIVIDPLTSAQPAAAALDLLRRQVRDRPVTAVIYTHSHVDHYGGVMGVLSADDIARGVPIVAPKGFLEAAVAENVLAGNVMSRRATYMYGGLLPKDPRGHVDSGLGKGVSTGRVALAPPNVSIDHTGQRLTLDGVEVVFQVTPDTEAPAEMNFHFPKFRALCMAENCTCHLHNLYTPRGAQVRDAKAWAFYIDEALDLFAGATDVMFASHHWPRWDEASIRGFLAKQRDLYKYIHDQTLRMANHGMTGAEIAEVLRLPPSLEAEWYTRSYYGTLSHNAKAVYQKYLGWFDGNPANLNRHPPEAAGRRYVEAMGGADRVLAEGRRAYDAGDYRWTAEIVGHLVFSDPAHAEARALQADALEQMGYQAESGPWRDFYLTGAQELRRPRPKSDSPRQASANQLRTLPGDSLLDALSVRLNGEAAGDETLRLTIAFTDTGEQFAVRIENAVLHHRRGDGGPGVALQRTDLVDLVTGARTVADLGLAGDGATALARLVALLDRFDLWFEISAP
ncbi:alkyl sulfatase dimerization domain-containing protein [Phenylobacterium sp. SCN 70-31]|uniref:alkyl/aryl-sulfatase n=1 Tax=Phenylobacterium sp. SCN 70-31 TaxID=1660129 RepID=UPI0025E870B9|nr:alkyl sulfatase dimerization domain-containing protein [Phenylobacterium sp. SCN 70-31]